VGNGGPGVIILLWELCWLECSFVGAGVIKESWELYWWECSYFWGWCDQIVMGVLLIGV